MRSTSGIRTAVRHAWALAALLFLGAAALPDEAQAQVDLRMRSCSFTPTSVAGSGSTITIGFSVQNLGTAAAGSFVVRYYYSDSTALTALTTICSSTIPSLGGGMTVAGSISCTLPSNVLYGTRYIHYFVDATGGGGDRRDQ